MSIGGIISAGLSGLQASQRGLQLVSQNLANANTPGYARVDLQLAPLAQTSGVDAGVVRRAADQFLVAASHSSESVHAAHAARAELLDRAQALLGDPGADGSLFSLIDSAFAGFGALGADPNSSIRRGSVVGDLQVLFAETGRVANAVEQLRLDADRRVEEKIASASLLIERIATLNGEIRRGVMAGADMTGAQSAQAALVDELSGLMDIRVSAREGGVEIRSGNGGLLLGERAAKLVYEARGVAYGAPGAIMVEDHSGVRRPFDGGFIGGAIGGLMTARDRDLPALAEGLGALAAAAADTLNAAHNDNASVPAPASLTGRRTGLDGADPHAFTGRATVGLVDSTGALLTRVEIDFDAGAISVNGAAAGAFTTVAGLAAALDGVAGLTAGFDALGRFSLGAETAGQGVTIRQGDASGASPSDRGGRGFAHFFGMNDLVVRPTPSFFETGLRSTDPHRLSADPITFLIRDRSGSVVGERSVTPQAGQTFAQLFAQINATTGIAPFGQIAALSPADPANASGRAAITPATGYSIEVVEDRTGRGTTGVSFSQLFGLGGRAGAGRAGELTVADRFVQNPALLALARPDLSLPLGARVVEAGDGRGAQALSAAQDVARARPAAGLMAAQTSSLTRYAATFAGEVGHAAAEAERQRDTALAIRTTAQERRTSMEGVQIDQELVLMTQYQQSYAAAGRLIQAAKEMFDVLLAIR